MSGSWKQHKRPEAGWSRKFGSRQHAEYVGNKVLSLGLIEEFVVKGGF